MKKSVLLVLTLLVVFLSPPVAGANFETVDILMARGQAGVALERLTQLFGENQANCAILWRMARGYYQMARSEDDVRVKESQLRQAENFARQAITADPDNDEGYKWLAIVLGAQAGEGQIGEQVRLSREVRENIEKAIALEPGDDISLLVFSRWHYKVAALGAWARTIVQIVYGDLPEASFEQAEALLLRAIAEHDRIVHRYALAKVYHRMGRRDAALTQLKLAVSLPVTFPEEAEELRKAQEKIEQWS